MISRLFVATLVVLQTSAWSDNLNKGREIFALECANCHSMLNTMEMLEDVKLEERSAHLYNLLKSHPAVLCHDDKKLVIDLLSQPDT